MPIYTFVCKKCGNEQEELVPMGTDVFECTKCGETAEKVMSVSSFILKGRCWESDGYNYNKEKVKE